MLTCPELALILQPVGLYWVRVSRPRSLRDESIVSTISTMRKQFHLVPQQDFDPEEEPPYARLRPFHRDYSSVQTQDTKATTSHWKGKRRSTRRLTVLRLNRR